MMPLTMETGRRGGFTADCSSIVSLNGGLVDYLITARVLILAASSPTIPQTVEVDTDS